MRDYEKRITETFLSNCSPDKAYEWLSANAEALVGVGVSRLWDLKRERKVLEYLLMRRKNPLIDLGLAQFGCTPYVLRTVFSRGGAGVRCGILANPLLFDHELLSEDPVINLKAVAKRGNRRELEALALNSHLPDSFYEDLVNRKGHCSELSDHDHKIMLYRLGENPRLSASYDDTYLDGYKDYKYHSVFTAVWQLAATVPATQEWAAVLVHLLHKAKPPIGLKDIPQIIERWKIDPPRKDDDRYYNPSYGFDLRSRLADLLEADDGLLSAEDPALRHSFYRRFSPQKYKNWPEFLQKDGEDFVQEAIQNTALWKSAEERERLKKVTWDSPDPSSDMMMPNVFRAREKSHREEHPEWFHAEDDEYSTEPTAVARRMEKLLKSIAERLDTLSVDEEPKRKWWK